MQRAPRRPGRPERPPWGHRLKRSQAARDGEALSPVEISFESNIREWTADLDAVRRRSLPFATAMALNDVAYEVMSENRQEMPDIFDRPVPLTVRSLAYRRATKETLLVSIYIRDQVAHGNAPDDYLRPQIMGGGRPHTRFERALIKRGIMDAGEYMVPSQSMRLDRYGNIPASRFVQILSQLAAGDAYQWETQRSRKRAGPKRIRVFVTQKGSRLPRGIWQENPQGGVSPIMMFVRSPRYAVRYPFHAMMLAKAERMFPRHFERRLARAMATDRGF